MKRKPGYGPIQFQPVPKRRKSSNASSGIPLYRRQVVKQDKKTYDAGAGAGNVPNTGAIVLLSGVTAGTGFNQRVGQKITLSSIQVTGEFVVADTNNHIQWRLIRWMSSGTPTQADLINSQSIAQNRAHLGYTNEDNGDKIKTLATGQLVLIDATNTAVREFKIFHRFSNQEEARFDSGGNADSGNIYFYMASDSSALAHPQYILASRLRYYG